MKKASGIFQYYVEGDDEKSLIEGNYSEPPYFSKAIPLFNLSLT